MFMFRSAKYILISLTVNYEEDGNVELITINVWSRRKSRKGIKCYQSLLFCIVKRRDISVFISTPEHCVLVSLKDK
jgi:hypothetical protein